MKFFKGIRTLLASVLCATMCVTGGLAISSLNGGNVKAADETVSSDIQMMIDAINKQGAHSAEYVTEDTIGGDETLKVSGIKVHIELEMRWRASVERVRELMNDGSLGTVTSFCAYNYSHYPFWWMHWMDIAELSYGKRVPLYPGAKHFRGGALTDHPHIFDLVRYMTGSEFDTVYAEVAPNMRDATETEDLVYIIGKMKNGVIVSLDPSYANREPEQCRTFNGRINHYPKPVQVELEVHGTKGTILCDAYGANSVETLVGDNFEYRVGGAGYPLDSYREPFLKNFARNIRLGDEYAPPISFKEHQNTMRVVNACYESIYTGKEIKIEYPED